jgi:hypothetical protein
LDGHFETIGDTLHHGARVAAHLVKAGDVELRIARTGVFIGGLHARL